jgi:ATP-binding cassette subfamily F protein 3
LPQTGFHRRHQSQGGDHAVVPRRRLDKIAVVGINGAGKSTLLKTICGQTEPTAGSVVLGANVQVGYFSQHSLDVLDPSKTIYDQIHDQIPDATIGFVRNLLGAFLFSGDDAYKKISVLSGGEKSRVVLATLLATPVNFLILDEPTNHLDIKSREVLLEAVKEFDGTVMVVSHDRHFLRSVTRRVFEVGSGALQPWLTGDGRPLGDWYDPEKGFNLRTIGETAGVIAGQNLLFRNHHGSSF